MRKMPSLILNRRRFTKFVKPKAVHIHALAYPYMSKNRIKISLDCLFQGTVQLHEISLMHIYQVFWHH
jgi:hypothetical protein